MTSGVDVSIVMANYNGARYLPPAIRSVIQQTVASWELIIVDDASTDNSLAVARQSAGGDPRIMIVTQPMNRGPGAARNRAIELARGRWIAVFDSDDVMLPQRLAVLLERATADGADIVADDLLLFSKRSRPHPFLPARWQRHARWIGIERFITSNCLYARVPPLGYLKPLIRIDIVRAAELRYDEGLRIGEDYNFIARLIARGHRLRLDPAALYLYRKHESSVSHRLRGADILGLIAAEDRFAEEAESLGLDLGRVLKRRRRSLRSLLVYDQVIRASKRGDLVTAARRALLRPHMWPLLTMPITARIKRLIEKLRIASPDGRSAEEELQPQTMLP